jgi:aspartyl-tRNA(Asn)/glutamyl-tRNA(Gln) amidotransferase subunit A
VYKSLGANIKEVSLPYSNDYALATYYLIACAEASSNLARYDGIKYGYRSESFDDLVDLYAQSRSKGFGKEVKRRILLGTYALSSGYYDAYYLKALKVRTLIKNSYEEAFKTCDAILTPTAPTTAFKINEKIVDPMQMYLSDIFTVPINLAGIPAISIPAGYDENDLPIGIQLAGPFFSEAKLYQLAQQFEKTVQLKYKASWDKED